MARIPNNRYSIEITHVDGTNTYQLLEPQNERTLPFILEAALFIRDTANTKNAVVIFRNKEQLDFGACGTTLDVAMHRLYEHFFKGKRDFFTSIVEKVELDDDGQINVVIDPNKLNRGKSIDPLSDTNVCAYYIQEMNLYYDICAARKLLPEFFTILGADLATVKYLCSNSVQERASKMPIRYVTPEGKRVSVVTRTHPRLGQGIPDIKFG